MCLIGFSTLVNNSSTFSQRPFCTHKKLKTRIFDWTDVSFTNRFTIWCLCHNTVSVSTQKSPIKIFLWYKVNWLNIHSTFPKQLATYIRLYTAPVYVQYGHEYSIHHTNNLLCDTLSLIKLASLMTWFFNYEKRWSNSVVQSPWEANSTSAS
jgi:hypothetical protein